MQLDKNPSGELLPTPNNITILSNRIVELENKINELGIKSVIFIGEISEEQLMELSLISNNRRDCNKLKGF